MKTLLALLLLVPSLSWGITNFKNYFKDNKYELDSIAYCGGFLQGVNDIVNYLMDEFGDEYIDVLPEDERKEINILQTNLNDFTKATRDELDFQLGMKCGEDKDCRYGVYETTMDGFDKGFNIVYTLNDTVDGWFSKEAEQYLDQSDVLLEMCFNKADG